jgi:integrase
MQTRSKKPLAPATVTNYRRYIEQDIAPSSLGQMQVREIHRRHVQSFVDDLAATRGAVTVARVVAVVQGALSQAVVDGLIDETPAHHLELPDAPRKDFEPWEVEQVGHFLDVAAQHRLGALFEVAVFTGLRRGELVGLRWADVDLTRREVRTPRAKTEAGVRRVALDDRAVGAIVAWQITQSGEAQALGADWTASGFVFTYADGQPLKPQYVTRLFEKLRVQAGLPKMTFHGQRHQQASLQLAAGTPLAVVSKRLGHSSVAVTADIYSHLLRSTEHDAANAAAALVPARSDIRAHTMHAQAPGNQKEAVSP